MKTHILYGIIAHGLSLIIQTFATTQILTHHPPLRACKSCTGELHQLNIDVLVEDQLEPHLDMVTVA